MPGLLADSAGGSAWTFGASILSFAFPMLLFIFVASALYVLYTKPEYVPGHPAPGLARPMSYTAMPGTAADEREAQARPAATETVRPAAAGTAATVPIPPAEPAGEASETTAGEAPEAGDAE
jgi:hypothetical protein